jgi:hypothetical protein
MSKAQEKALLYLCIALVVGACCQAVANQEAALLGFTVFELALMGVAAGAVAKRVVL